MIRLTILGASPSFPNPGGACSGYLLESGDTRLLLECGHGVVSRLLQATRIEELTAVLITHMDPDHFFDLLPLKYAYRFECPRSSPLPLLLPPGGLDSLAGLSAALGGRDVLEGTYAAREFDPDRTTSIGAFSLTFAPTQHYISGFAVRLETEEAAPFCFTSDTGPTGSVRELAKRAGLLLCEATLLEQDPDEPFHGHMTAAQAGTLARESGAHRLILTHYSRSQARALAGDAEKTFRGEVKMAEEGQSYDL